MLSDIHLQKLVQRWKGDTPLSSLDIPPYTPGDQLYEFQNEQEETIDNESPSVLVSPPAHVVTNKESAPPVQHKPPHHISAIKSFSLNSMSISVDSISAFNPHQSTETKRIENDTIKYQGENDTEKHQAQVDQLTHQDEMDRVIEEKIDQAIEQSEMDRVTVQGQVDRVTEQGQIDRETEQAEVYRVTEQAEIDRVIEQSEIDQPKAEKIIPFTKELPSVQVETSPLLTISEQIMTSEGKVDFNFEDDGMDYVYDDMMQQSTTSDQLTVEKLPAQVDELARQDEMDRVIEEIVDQAIRQDEIDQPEVENIIPLPSVQVETPPLPTNSLQIMANEDKEVDFNFEDDGMDYGYDDMMQQSATSDQVAIEIQSSIDPLDEAFKAVKQISQGKSYSSKKAKNLANAHIQAIRQVSQDVMKEMRQVTVDAFEKSLIEDYYNSVNSTLKSHLKKFNNYQDVHVGLQRVRNYYQRKEVEMAQLVQEDAAISKEIEIQTNNLQDINKNEMSFVAMEDLFNSINKLK